MRRSKTFLVAFCLLTSVGRAAEGSPEQIQFFEQTIRPLLVKSCLGCHNDQTKMSGLSLASRESAMLGGNRGSAVIPGQTAESLLLQAVGREGDLKMPPTGPLAAEDVQALTAWVQNGAAWGDAGGRVRATASHWSFQPVRRPEPPAVQDASWVRTPIDRFVLAKLEEKGVKPSAEADRRTLIRRVSLDLLGLPPSAAEIEAFLADDRPDAYERLVDRLLDSPRYGERWGRHWLDIARYADSNGYSIDGARSIWRYRDWVINALNNDMPFDQFVVEQIAGDLLPNPTQEQLIATGFHRNTMINQEGGIDYEQYRVEAVVDRVSTTGAAFLGLTVGCARCHDHKFDPIAQREFYQLYAFFNNIDELGGNIPDGEGPSRTMDPLLEFGEPDQFARRDALKGQIAILEAELLDYQKELEKDWKRFATGEDAELEARVQAVLETPVEQRSTVDRGTLQRFFAARDPAWKAREDGIKALRGEFPRIESTMIMRELPEPREAHVLIQGDFTRPGDEVEPGGLSVLPAMPQGKTLNRLDLAHWLISEDNPLTPRVTVNRMWQRYFGLGIVETEGDFGSQGTLPSHPELLDWLASELIRRDWGMKSMHRLIVTSATYRQSSEARPNAAQVDPSNRLLARQNRTRLEAEIIRDAALAASGLLTDKIGGPSVFPPQPAGAGQFTQVDRQWKADEGPDRYRRGMYTFFWRSAPHPGLTLFDAPNAQEATTRRNSSDTPLQALTLLNDQAQAEFAAALAKRVLAAEEDRDGRLRFAFETCLARPPAPDEQQRMDAYLARMTDEFSTSEQARQALGSSTAEEAAWTAASRVLLNLDEFVTRQ
ncbi:MAG: DUF1549 domain-containing protein [Acidobacteria bacterium]|nr:DUF1549 domain-containing protein [Acidobacteriota bacterium]